MTPYFEEEFRPRIDFGLWHRIFSFALQRKRFLYPLLGCALLIGLIDSLFPLITKLAVDVVENKGRGQDLILPGVAFLLLTLGLTSSVFYFIRLAGAISHHIAHDIKRDCFARLQELEFAFYDKQPTGWLISRLTADCDRLSRILAWGFTDIVWGSLFVAAMTIVMLALDWKLALLVLSTVPPLIALSLFFQRRMLLSSRLVRKRNAQITASYGEGIAGVKTTKTLGREAQNLDEFQGESRGMYQASVHRAFLNAIYLPLVMLLGAIGSGLALWYGGAGTLSDRISLGTLIAFISYAGNFFNPINQMAAIFAEIQGAQAAGERVMSLLATEPKITDSPTVRQRIAEFSNASAADTVIAPDGYPDAISEIAFRNVSFAYNPEEPVLTAFNLVVQRGQTIALVGPSGGGKSTIVSLVSRFYEPTAGEIRIDGIDYRQRSLAWLQAQLGIVLQTPHLFNGSVKENIRYGRLDATDAEVQQAAEIVNAHRFVEKLKNGYDTSIGEGGARLSTGERQLISFARALLADPQVFIMDEATSSIDAETEKLIQEGMQRVLHGRISFVIAHRLSTIRSADLILVINAGEIEEQGTHRELLSQRGHYHDLYANQFRNEGLRDALGTIS